MTLIASITDFNTAVDKKEPIEYYSVISKKWNIVYDCYDQSTNPFDQKIIQRYIEAGYLRTYKEPTDEEQREMESLLKSLLQIANDYSVDSVKTLVSELPVILKEHGEAITIIDKAKACLEECYVHNVTRTVIELVKILEEFKPLNYRE